MRIQTDILIIGGGPAGMVSAGTAKRYYPGKKITLLKNVADGCIPCGIPYMISSLKDPAGNRMSTDALEKSGVNVAVDEAVSIDRSGRTVFTRNGDTIAYEKLILAVGSKPIIPPIPGIGNKGVYPVYKDMSYLVPAVEDLKKAGHVVVIGGGFIGVEFADELSRVPNLRVTLVEMCDRLLINSFDSEFSSLAEEKLRARGVRVFTKTAVQEVIGGGHVEKVRLSSGETLEADRVILGVGASPLTDLACQAGLDLGRGKGIWVDEYMRTSDPDIFAVGDCAGKRDFYTRKDAVVMLASTATAEARIAGANLYKLIVVRENKGTIAAYSTCIDGLVMGSAGLTECTALKENFEIVSGSAQAMDKHPGTLPGAQKTLVKLIFSKNSGIILGGQAAGGIGCGELINVIGMAIQQRVSCSELGTLQMATHPFLTPAPTLYPVVTAAFDAAGKM